MPVGNFTRTRSTLARAIFLLTNLLPLTLASIRANPELPKNGERPERNRNIEPGFIRRKDLPSVPS
jgi:hypothetical protein